MYCKNCGKEIPEGAKFCPACGTATGAAQKQTASYTQDAGQQTAKENTGRTQTNAAASSSGNGWILSVIGPQPNFTIGSYLVWAGCVVSFISLFLSVYDISFFGYTQSLRMIDMDQGIWLVVLLIVIALINIFKLYLGDIIGAAIIGVILINGLSNAGKLLDTVDSVGSMFGAEGLSSELGSFTAGVVVVVIGVLLMLAGGIAGLVMTMQAHKQEL